jgi:hypothetical protein
MVESAAGSSRSKTGHVSGLSGTIFTLVLGNRFTLLMRASTLGYKTPY